MVVVFAKVFEQECLFVALSRIEFELNCGQMGRFGHAAAWQATGSTRAHINGPVHHEIPSRNHRFHCVTRMTSSRSNEFVRAFCRTVEAGCGSGTVRAADIQPTSNAQLNLSLCSTLSMNLVSVTLRVSREWRVRCERLFGGPNGACYWTCNPQETHRNAAGQLQYQTHARGTCKCFVHHTCKLSGTMIVASTLTRAAKPVPWLKSARMRCLCGQAGHHQSQSPARTRWKCSTIDDVIHTRSDKVCWFSTTDRLGVWRTIWQAGAHWRTLANSGGPRKHTLHTGTFLRRSGPCSTTSGMISSRFTAFSTTAARVRASSRPLRRNSRTTSSKSHRQALLGGSGTRIAMVLSYISVVMAS